MEDHSSLRSSSGESLLQRWARLCYSRRRGIIFLSIWQLLLGMEAMVLNVLVLVLGRQHLGTYPLTNAAGFCSGGWALIIGSLGISVWRRINSHHRNTSRPIKHIRNTYIVQSLFNCINLIVSVQLIVFSASITIGCHGDTKADWCVQNWNSLLVCGILGILVGAVNWILSIPSIIIFAVMERRYQEGNKNGYSLPSDQHSIVDDD